jgi:predicted aldo/keto reductase-like oxidoreductase
LHHYIGFTVEGPSAGVEELIAAGTFETMQVRYNLMYQHPSDWHNNTGVIRQAKEQDISVILMRPLTSGVFQRLMAEAFPDIDAVASDGWSGAAAAQLRALGPVRGCGAGWRAGTALCGAEQ